MKCALGRPETSRAGFSLVELLMVIAVMSSITAGAVFTFTSVSKATESTKLQRDVAVINRAIRLYVVNGGTFIQADLKSPSTILSKLKKRASADSAQQIAGLRNSMADERLTFEMQSDGDARDGAERARFVPDPANPRFVIQKGGPPGISRFLLDASLANHDFGTEDRAVSLKLAKNDPWVWDYIETENRRAEPGSSPSTQPDTAVTGVSNSANTALEPPDFSLAAGALPLYSFPNSLTLTPTNPEGTSQIHYSINSGPFTPYTGPLSIDPGVTVTAISVTLDPDNYDDSETRSRSYTSAGITPLVTTIFSKSAYTYFELGGPAAPGTPSSPAGTVSGTGYILNSLLIPVRYQNSSVFRFVWTIDGSDPFDSATAIRQGDFSGGFFPVNLPLPLTAFDGVSKVAFKAAVKSANPSTVANSEVITRNLDAAVIPLRPPLIDIDGRDVTLELNLSYRDMPADARIFYTTDGTDPGVDQAGNPLRGTLYSGNSFSLDGITGNKATVTARTYAPLKYMQFFTASPTAASTLTLPPSTDLYVGGNFVNSGGSLMRNIAKLNNSGQVDVRFDTGTGASKDSLVGVVRQSTGGVVAGGDFESMNGTPRPAAVRLLPGGGVDASFNAGLTAE